MVDDKKAAKELKAQRRAAKVAEKQAHLPEGAIAEAQQAAAAAASAKKAEGQASSAKKDDVASGKAGGASVSVSVSATPAATPTAAASTQAKHSIPEPAPDSLFSHLERRPLLTSEHLSRDIHPETVALALRYSHGQCIGSNTRCIAMLDCFKILIADYVTPPGTTLSRNLSPYLSTQISYLITARPLSVSMGTAIRLLKQAISTRDIDKPDDDLKEELFDFIETFKGERITVAGQVIVKLATPRISDGDVVLVYAHSTIVLKILLAAAEQGTRFSVVVADSRPNFEGRRMLDVLTTARVGGTMKDDLVGLPRGIPVTYIQLTGLSYALKSVTKCLLGAHAVLANGALYSRAGTALVSMACYEAHIPVMVACETYKFGDRVQLDSFVINELGHTTGMDVPQAAKNSKASGQTSTEPTHSGKGKQAGKDEQKGTKGTSKEDAKSGTGPSKAGDENMDPMSLVRKLNIMYDITPAKYITLCISELGSLPSTSVPAALREQNRDILV